MAREIPEAVRAAAGLAATVLEEARRLPETLPSLPVRALGLAMQLSMKVQQHYADLVARGDELFTGILGENEPGLATFDDDDDEPAGPVATAAKVGQSAFDRVAETVIEITEDDDSGAGYSPAGDDDVAVAADQALDELAIEELVAEAPVGEDADGLPEPQVLEDSPAPDSVPDEAVVETAVDVLSPDGEVQTVEATLTDEGVAAPEQSAPEPSAAEPSAAEPSAAEGGTAEPSAAEGGTATDEGGTPVAAAGPNTITPPATAPVEGYDDWSIAQLRSRLRGYQAVTVTELIAYEESTRSREPYLRMLRNRLEGLDEQAVESSPLAPRGT